MLLVSSCRHPGRWVVPSGGVEPGEDSKEAAIREVVEEVSNRSDPGFVFASFRQLDKTLSALCLRTLSLFLCLVLNLSCVAFVCSYLQAGVRGRLGRFLGEFQVCIFTTVF